MHRLQELCQQTQSYFHDQGRCKGRLHRVHAPIKELTETRVLGRAGESESAGPPVGEYKRDP
jgi:hypothetical protein